VWIETSNYPHCEVHVNKLSVIVVVSALVGCSSSNEEDIGSASVAIMNVPSDVGCVKLTAVGARTVERAYSVTPGTAATLVMTSLPIGSVTFSGSSYAEACSGALTTPTWVAAPVTATITSTGTVPVNLIMRRDGKASVTVDYEPDDAGAETSTDTGTLKANGAACAASAECGSGFCVDGVCCNTACTGGCQSCSGTWNIGGDGFCSAIDCGDPQNECPGTALCVNGSCGSICL
jgi:hypothetical protein